MKIGILGGTFNPVHLGHLILAQEAYRHFSLEKVLFIPSRVPPHKEATPLAAPEHRYNMVDIAIDSNPVFEASDIELKRQKTSYSVDTLRELKNTYGSNTEIYFLTGSDSLQELSSWKDVDEVLRLCRFVVATRPMFPMENPPENTELLVIPSVEISSSDVRQRVAENKSIRYLVPDGVRQYILDNKLYA